MITNKFYNEFDIQLMDGINGRNLYERTPFQQDRDRIIYTSSFRRLQSKTQVFFSGEYDFYRTRLTHSLEVAQIGRSLCHYLKEESNELHGDFYIDSDLVEAICLAHDIGHPPFGHAGETTINKLMQPYGGFEGNAQTLRMLTETIYSATSGREGMNPTRALTDGVMKYKRLYSKSYRNSIPPKNHFLYDEQQSYVQFIFGQRQTPAEVDLNKFRSIECQIMDWADDTAYSINDLLDGISSGLITQSKIESWAANSVFTNEENSWIANLLKAMNDRQVARFCSRKIGECIRAVSLKAVTNFMSDITNRHAFYLKIDAEKRAEIDLYGRISRELVFFSPQIYQLEYKGDYILRKIFEAFEKHYLTNDNQTSMTLLPDHTEQPVRAEKEVKKRARLICDYVTGMTDGFALRTYKRLYDPDFGSIMDLV